MSLCDQVPSGYFFLPGKTSHGHSCARLVGASVNDLFVRCEEDSRIIAFNTGGEMKCVSNNIDDINKTNYEGYDKDDPSDKPNPAITEQGLFIHIERLRERALYDYEVLTKNMAKFNVKIATPQLNWVLRMPRLRKMVGVLKCPYIKTETLQYLLGDGNDQYEFVFTDRDSLRSAFEEFGLWVMIQHTEQYHPPDRTIIVFLPRSNLSRMCTYDPFDYLQISEYNYMLDFKQYLLDIIKKFI